MGTFDGVHLGHMSILEKLIQIAEKNNGETIVVTFEPHPRIVLHLDDKNLRFLNTKEEKKKLLQKIGIDHLVLLEFTKEFSNMSSEKYIKTILVDKLNTKSLVIGYDHHFGKSRSGDFSNLIKLANKFNFNVEQLKAKEKNHVAVSSTKIRNALYSGNIEMANNMLGYKYFLSGKVGRGKKIGMKLGFPTANILVNDKYKLIPAHGVYAVYIKWRAKIYHGMLSIGSKPTFDEYKENIEVHIFDFNYSIYGEQITVTFVSRIRDIVKFSNAEALRDQLFLDMKRSKELLYNNP